jgi:dUTP pyrophosphatase
MKTETIIKIIKMTKTFEVKVVDEADNELYQNHSTYHAGDAGFDLFVVKDTTIGPGETVLVDMGVQCQSKSFSWCVWKWFKGQYYNYHSYFLIPRSSISKTPLMMRNSVGVIDSSYTGSIKAPLFNTSTEPFFLKRGERYTQLVNADMSPVKMEVVDSLRSTSRSGNGFGSTGK